ncbi:MAG TPA: Coq4 family protein [Polyangiaceae bacterium]
MPTLWEELRFITHLNGIEGDARDLEHIRRLGEIATNLRDPRPALHVAARAMRDRGFRALYERGYRPPLPSPERLRELAPGTLGRAYGDHMVRAGLSPDFMGECRASDPLLAYLADRIFRTHDIAHVVTGYDTSVSGELSLQGFSFGQLPSGVHLGIVVVGLFKTLRRDLEAIQPTFDGIARAYLRGQEARFLLGVPWEELWHRPLAELRAEMRLEPVPEASTCAA